jgi:hypothetical protein
MSNIITNNEQRLKLPDGRALISVVDNDATYPRISIYVEDSNGHREQVAVVEYNTMDDEPQRLATWVYCEEHDEPVFMEPYSKFLPESPNI